MCPFLFPMSRKLHMEGKLKCAMCVIRKSDATDSENLGKKKKKKRHVLTYLYNTLINVLYLINK